MGTSREQFRSHWQGCGKRHRGQVPENGREVALSCFKEKEDVNQVHQKWKPLTGLTLRTLSMRTYLFFPVISVFLIKSITSPYKPCLLCSFELSNRWVILLTFKLLTWKYSWALSGQGPNVLLTCKQLREKKCWLNRKNYGAKIYLNSPLSNPQLASAARPMVYSESQVFSLPSL